MDDALLSLGRALQSSGYRFITPTPETHRRVFARRSTARDLRDVFGWSRPFTREVLPGEMLRDLERAGALEQQGDLLKSSVRFSTLGSQLFVHSAFPTDQADCVFFGPDTYRFCAFLEREAASLPARFVVDIGCGSGAGGLVAARASGAPRLCMLDINERALAFARVNASLASSGAERYVEALHSDVLASLQGAPDLIVANPPYMRDPTARVYRDGGGDFGEALAVRIVSESLARLAPSGTLLLYTGAAVVDGDDVFFSAIQQLLSESSYRYVELDPDVFGEELEKPGYERVERIAATGLVVTKPA